MIKLEGFTKGHVTINPEWFHRDGPVLDQKYGTKTVSKIIPSQNSNDGEFIKQIVYSSK